MSAAELGYDHVMSFDMGGTTAKLGTIDNGEPIVTAAYEVDTINSKRNSGLPLNILAIELLEIGVRRRQHRRHEDGSRSQSARRAPAPCPVRSAIGQGGRRPTITDANLVLGYLNADYFNGGAMTLDRPSAAAGIEAAIAAPLGLPLAGAAWGIHSIANSNMERAMRVISVERGRDPRDYALVAFGGAGPLHACRLARAMGIPTVIVPFAAGVGSAVGLLVADHKVDAGATRMIKLDGSATDEIAATLDELERARTPGRAAARARHRRRDFAQRLYAHSGQGYDIRVALPAGQVDDAYETEDARGILRDLSAGIRVRRSRFAGRDHGLVCGHLARERAFRGADRP